MAGAWPATALREVGWDVLAQAGQRTVLGDTHPDLGDTLKVEVSFGDQTQEFPIEPFFDEEEGFGIPGDYRAWLIPTRAGTYSFHFTGTIDGEDVDDA